MIIGIFALVGSGIDQLDVSDYHQTDGAVAGHSLSFNAGQIRIDGGQLTADTALSLKASTLSCR